MEWGDGDVDGALWPWSFSSIGSTVVRPNLAFESRSQGTANLRRTQTAVPGTAMAQKRARSNVDGAPKGRARGAAAASGAQPAPAGPRPQLGHLVVEADGTRARMVDVGQKSAGERSALARARVHLPPRAFEALVSGQNPKGPVEEVARVAGVLAAKSTDRLIPLCHSIPLSFVDVTFVRGPGPRIDVLCEARCHGVTGVEMEALVGASVAALTVYDMLKGLDHGIRVEAVELLEKRGGRSGTWRAAGYAGAD